MQYNNKLSSKNSLSSSDCLDSSYYVNTLRSEEKKNLLVSNDQGKNANLYFSNKNIKKNIFNNNTDDNEENIRFKYKHLQENVKDIKFKKLNKNKDSTNELATDTQDKKNLIDSIFFNDLKDTSRSNRNNNNNNDTTLLKANNNLNLPFKLKNNNNKSITNLLSIKEVNGSNLNSNRSNYNDININKSNFFNNLNEKKNENKQSLQNVKFKNFNKNNKNNNNNNNPDNSNGKSLNKIGGANNILNNLNNNYEIKISDKSNHENFEYCGYELNEQNYESTKVKFQKLFDFNAMKKSEKIQLTEDNQIKEKLKNGILNLPNSKANLHSSFKNSYSNNNNNNLTNNIILRSLNDLNAKNLNKKPERNLVEEINNLSLDENNEEKKKAAEDFLLNHFSSSNQNKNSSSNNNKNNKITNNLLKNNINLFTRRPSETRRNSEAEKKEKKRSNSLTKNISSNNSPNNSPKIHSNKNINNNNNNNKNNSNNKSTIKAESNLGTLKSRKTSKDFAHTKTHMPKGKNARKYAFRKIQTLKNVCDSLTENEESEDDNKSAPNSFLDNRYFKAYWFLVNLCFSLYYATLGIYRFTFFPNEVSGILFFFEILIDFIFIVDIILHFLTPFSKNNKTVFDRNLIASNYLAGWFIFDLCSSIPLNLLLLINDYEIRKSSIFLALNIHNEDYVIYSHLDAYIRKMQITNYFTFKLLRWLRIIKVIKLFSSEKKTNLSEVLFGKRQKINDYLKIIFVFVILTHISTCLWIFIGNLQDPTIEKTWLNTIQDYWSMSNWDIYIASLYFNLLTIYTVGYGDITSKNNSERIYNIFILTIGNLLFSFGISYLSFLFANINEMDNKFQKKMKIMEKIEKKYSIPKNLNRQIKRNIKNMYTKAHMEKFIIFDSLPLVLKREFILSMHKKGISNFIFFKYSDKEFIIAVLPLLKTQLLAKNDILVSIGGIVEEIFLINQGILSICLDELFDNIQISQLKRNFHFGDILIHLNEKSPYLIQCSTKACEYLTLSKSDYNKISVNFNKIVMKILEFSCEFLEKIEKNKHVILELFDEGMKLHEIRSLIKSINYHLINRNFYNHFYNNEEMPQVEDFILINDIKKIIKFSKTKMQEVDFKRFFRNIFEGNILIKKNWVAKNKQISEATNSAPSVIMQNAASAADKEHNKKIHRRDYRRKSLIFKDQLLSMGTRIKNFFSDSEKKNLTENNKKNASKNQIANSSIKEELEYLTEKNRTEEKQPEAARAASSNIENDVNLLNEEISLQNKLKTMFGKKIEEIVKKSEKNLEDSAQRNCSDSLSISEDELQMMNYAGSNNTLTLLDNMPNLLGAAMIKRQTEKAEKAAKGFKPMLSKAKIFFVPKTRTQSNMKVKGFDVACEANSEKESDSAWLCDS